MKEISRFDVWLIELDPARGSEIRKTGPCCVISPDEMNRSISTVIIAPMTTKGRSYPSRVPCHFQGKQGRIILDQLRTVDTHRLKRRLGVITEPEQEEVLRVLLEMFAR